MTLVVALAGVCQETQASIQLSFGKVTSNNAENLSAQLGVEVFGATEANNAFGTGLSGNQVLFVVTNAVGIASNVTEFYIDDGTVVAQASIINSLGGGVGNFTNFAGPGANPSNLPSGNTVSPPFVATVGFSADVANGPGGQDKGVNAAADKLGIVFDTNSGLQGIIDAINKPATDTGNLRVGLHVASIGALGGSDSYVSTGIIIPEPASLLVWGSLAIAGACVARRRMSK